MQENLSSGFASAQSDQRLCFVLFFWTISYIDLLVSVAEETGLKLALSESPKTGFLTSRPKWGKRLVFFFQETARNHFWEAGMLMQSYMLNIVQ